MRGRLYGLRHDVLTGLGAFALLSRPAKPHLRPMATRRKLSAGIPTGWASPGNVAASAATKVAKHCPKYYDRLK